MKKAILLAAGIEIMVTLPMSAAIVANADFEGGDDSWRLKPAYSVQSGAGMNGSAGLVYENADPDLPYAFPSQPITLKAGESYRFSAWVRTENLVSAKGSGATLALEWADAEGRHLGGSYSKGLKGTHDWTLVEGVTTAIPEKAASFTAGQSSMASPSSPWGCSRAPPAAAPTT